MVDVVDQLLSTIRTRHPHASQKQVATMLPGCLNHYNGNVRRNGWGNGRSNSSLRTPLEEGGPEESIPEIVKPKKFTYEEKPSSSTSEEEVFKRKTSLHARLKSQQPEDSSDDTNTNETTAEQPNPDEDASTNSTPTLQSSRSGLTSERNTPETERLEESKESDGEDGEDDNKTPKDPEIENKNLDDSGKANAPTPQTPRNLTYSYNPNNPDPETSSDTLSDSDKENEHAGPSAGSAESEAEEEDEVDGGGTGSRSVLRGRGGPGGRDELMTPPESP